MARARRRVRTQATSGPGGVSGGTGSWQADAAALVAVAVAAAILCAGGMARAAGDSSRTEARQRLLQVEQSLGSVDARQRRLQDRVAAIEFPSGNHDPRHGHAGGGDPEPRGPAVGP